MLIQARAQLAAMVHATYRDNLTKGSDAWRTHQAAKRALDEFDLAQPITAMERNKYKGAESQKKAPMWISCCKLTP